MRVYEFSKQHGLTSKDVLQALESAGFKLSGHMAVLKPDHLEYLKKKYIVKDSSALKKGKQDKSKKAKPEKSATKVTPSGGDKETMTENNIQSVSKDVHVSPQGELVLKEMVVGDFCDLVGLPISQVIVTLLQWGIVAAKNQSISADVVKRLADHFDLSYVRKQKKSKSDEGARAAIKAGSDAKLKERLPVVVVLGHVDHGKTTLLDFIRKTRVTAREKGGITQHVGAYKAQTPQGDIVFIDTPGHEAFSKMRQRGARLADVVVIVVAADDSVMPQTIEAIKHAKAMGGPILVAANKIDRVDPARVDIVKRDIAKHDLLPEDWGGDVVVVPISAKTGEGVDQLLDMIILQSQMLELKAEHTGPARGYTLESKLEKGRGPVATVLTQHGTLRVGDYFSCGKTHGKVSSLVNSRGKRIQSVGPSVPVSVAGFDSLPMPGDYFEKVTKAEYKDVVRGSWEKPRATSRRTYESSEVVNLIVKTDTRSSQEALLESIYKIAKHADGVVNVVHASIGGINESDVELAQTTDSTVVGLHVKVEPNARTLARRAGVNIKLFEIIYKLLEDVERDIKGRKIIEKVRKRIGTAEVRRVFNIKGVGVIAGCYVKDGRIINNGFVHITRNGEKIGEGTIKSLQREKKVVKEIHANYECAFLVDGFSEWEVDDIVECYQYLPAQ